MIVKIFAGASLCALVVGGFYYFDRKIPTDEVWWENEHYRMDLQHQIQLSNLRLERRSKGSTASGVAEAEARLQTLDSKFEELAARHGLVTAGLEKVQGEFVAFREKRLTELRERAKGREWTEFASATGKVLKQAKVVEVDDAGVTVRHQDGSARLRYDELTDEQRQLFGLEEGSAIAAMKEEQRRAHEYERWLANESGNAQDKEADRRVATEMNLALSDMQRHLPKARRFRADVPVSAPAAGPTKDSPFGTKSLSAPPTRIGQNARFRVNGGPRYVYYYNYGTSSAYTHPMKRLPTDN